MAPLRLSPPKLAMGLGVAVEEQLVVDVLVCLLGLEL
jgi:hypothetical protein